MAFMGMFMIFLVIFLLIIGGCTLGGVVLLVSSVVMKKKQKEKYMLPRVVGVILMLPLLLVSCLIIYAVISSKIENYNSLSYNVNQGNYARVEELLIKGIEPDCTLESNEPAKDGEQTLLSVLCANGGFVDSFEDTIDDEVTEAELDMMRLLIRYGADIEARDYRHEADSKNHKMVDETDYYSVDDQCGYTPLLHAVYSCDEEIVKLLVESGADVNVRSYCGFTPVHTIADNFGDEDGEEMLRYLIDNGAHVDGLTNFGQDATFLAVRNTFGDNALENYYIMEILYEELMKISQ